ncbi:MAG: DNA polymerase III [Planctomycetes bacterium]|nr:DNA polymerase III [Planctomycetota bacterium]
MKSSPADHQLCLPFADAPRQPTASSSLDNHEVARRLDEIAERLEAQAGSPFRVRAYAAAAETLRGLDRSVAEIVRREGLPGLRSLPGIGRSLALTIERLAGSGRSTLLERLRAKSAPEKVFATVPDIGSGLARQIHDRLGIETLAELEAAANDGRLAQVPGMGSKRVLAVRESLAGRFRRRRVPASTSTFESPPLDEPPVAELLDVDRQYRVLAEADRLPRIAPRRFNPTAEAWLPVLHTQRGGAHYTAMYSNTARAHELEATRDWVVIYRNGPRARGRWTVITSRYGALEDRRIVRGREGECAAHYRLQTGVRPRPR